MWRNPVESFHEKSNPFVFVCRSWCEFNFCPCGRHPDTGRRPSGFGAKVVRAGPPTSNAGTGASQNFSECGGTTGQGHSQHNRDLFWKKCGSTNRPGAGHSDCITCDRCARCGYASSFPRSSFVAPVTVTSDYFIPDVCVPADEVPAAEFPRSRRRSNFHPERQLGKETAVRIASPESGSLFLWLSGWTTPAPMLHCSGHVNTSACRPKSKPSPARHYGSRAGAGAFALS